MLPPYYDRGDVEGLIAQAEERLYHQTEKQKQRNKALILTLAYTSMSRSELLKLLVGDVDFNRRTIRVKSFDSVGSLEQSQQFLTNALDGLTQKEAAWSPGPECNSFALLPQCLQFKFYPESTEQRNHLFQCLTLVHN